MKTLVKEKARYYLTCERDWVYFTLIAVGGFWGAYTYLLRGGVFCNAQTSNVVLMGMALGSARPTRWGHSSRRSCPTPSNTAC